MEHINFTERAEFSADSLQLQTKRQTLGQILVCANSCCCGRTDKGKPTVPVDWLKREWKERRLLRHIQLSISGCIGPCDPVNVVCIVTPAETIWLGGLTENYHFEALLDWSINSADSGKLMPLPVKLQKHRFERWHPPAIEEDCPCCAMPAA